MSKRDLIDSGSSKSFYRRSDTGRFVTVREAKSHPWTSVKETVKGDLKPAVKRDSYRSAVSGRYVTLKDVKSGSYEMVRRHYSMPNGEKIVTVRRDIVDRALGRKDKKK